MRPHYRNPPLAEAIFEFAPEGARLDPTGAAALSEELAREYTGKSDRAQGFLGIEFDLTEGTTRQMEPPPARHRRWNADGTRLVQVAPDLCAFNALPPYTHYETYLPAIESLFEAYVRRAQPTATAFLGQRYLNRFLLPSADVVPGDFFTMYPASPQARELLHPPFMLHIQTEKPEGPGGGQVLLTLTYQGLDKGQRPSYMLDIYARSMDKPPIPFNWSAVRAWQDVAHAAVKRAFEFAITDRCRELLGKEEGE